MPDAGHLRHSAGFRDWRGRQNLRRLRFVRFYLDRFLGVGANRLLPVAESPQYRPAKSDGDQNRCRDKCDRHYGRLSAWTLAGRFQFFWAQ